MNKVQVLIEGHASNMEALKESRQKVLEISDFIIPGHGRMFKVDKK